MAMTVAEIQLPKEYKIYEALETAIYDLEIMKKGNLFFEGSIVDINLQAAKAAIKAATE